MSHEPRYWKLYPAPAPGDVVAEHDGGVGLDDARPNGGLASGPGNYRVIVRRAGQSIAAGEDGIRSRWPIELSVMKMDGFGQPFRFNPGMARWFGLRLIEAAAICETFDVEGGATMSVAPAEIERLAEFILENLPDSTIRGSAVDNAIRLLRESMTSEAPTDPDWQSKDRKDFIQILNRMVQPDTQLWFTARELFDEGVAVDHVIYGLARVLDHPTTEQTASYFRGVVVERVRRAKILAVSSRPKVESD